ncbi:MAG: 1-phosphofructokinase family hexose kinase [Thermotaleaceae bacterium]
MITTITLNPAIDRSYVISDFRPNKSYVVDNATISAGGKGVNVARIASMLGEQVNAMGLLGGTTGRLIQAELEKLHIHTSFVWIQEATRVFTAIVDPLNQTETFVDEKGPQVTKRELNAFVKEFVKVLKYSEIIVASGTLPPGLPKTIYGDMVKIARDNNVSMIIDACGSYLEEAIKAKPFMVKTNLGALEELSGYDLDCEYKIIYESKCICRQGIEVAAISLGEKGAIFTTPEGSYRLCVPKVEAVNPIGCGDAFVAGFAVSYFRDKNIKQAFRYAAATGTANAMKATLENIDNKLIRKIYDEIKIKRVE